MAMTGTVRFFNGVRGYGFIKPDDGSAVERAGLNYLTAGQRITFDVEPEKEGQRPQGGETGDRILKWRATPIPRLEPLPLSSAHDRGRPSGFIEPCLPSKVARPPSGPLWVHEIKHDRYRLMVRRDGSRVRCFTRNGHDWADRFPAIVDAALRIRAQSFLIDGEAVARDDGTPDFHALRPAQPAFIKGPTGRRRAQPR
jgi:cold shock CspA family protein